MTLLDSAAQLSSAYRTASQFSRLPLPLPADRRAISGESRDWSRASPPLQLLNPATLPPPPQRRLGPAPADHASSLRGAAGEDVGSVRHAGGMLMVPPIWGYGRR